MIDEGLEQPWPEPVPPAVEPFLQGHLIAQPPLFYAADLRHPIWRTTRLIADEMPAADRGEDFVDLVPEDRPPYGIITTQSCDPQRGTTRSSATVACRRARLRRVERLTAARP